MASVKINYAKDGRTIISYRVRACIGRDEKGKQILISRTVEPPLGLTPAKALKKVQSDADAWEEAVKKGDAPAKKQTFKSFIEDDFLPVHVCNGEHSPATEFFYKDICKRLVERFGGKQLTAIRGMDIEKYLAEMHTEKYTKKNGEQAIYSASYIDHFRTVLAVAFGFAEKHGLIEKNPMRFVSSVKQESKRIDYLDAQEAKAFLEALSKEAPMFWDTAMRCLIYLGLRRGELAGLQWGDIDFDNESIRICRDVINNVETGRKNLVKEVKTDASNALLPLPMPLIPALKEWKKKVVSDYGFIMPSAFVFPALPDSYSPIRPDSITQWLGRFTKRYGETYGFHNVSPHDLRHTFASLLMGAGASVKEVQLLCRHADASTTLKFYAGANHKALKGATDRLASALAAE